MHKVINFKVADIELDFWLISILLFYVPYSFDATSSLHTPTHTP